MKFDFICIKLFKWEIGIMLGDDVGKIPLFKIEIAALGVTFKLIEIAI